MSHTTAGSASCFTALIGGSFDPIHNGHLFVAAELLKDPLINRLAFVPVGRHNFKHALTVLSFSQRSSLIARAIEPGMELWDDDEAGSGYTSDLIQRLRKSHPGMRFAFVIGSDNLPQLPQWHDYEWLRQELSFIVIPRPGYELSLPEPAPQVMIRDIHPPEVSSSQIRSRIKAGLPIDGLVPVHLKTDIIKLYKEASQHER